MYEKSEDTTTLYNPKFFSTESKKKKGGVIIEHSRTFEWIKVKTYLTIINGQLAFESLYKKVYH